MNEKEEMLKNLEKVMSGIVGCMNKDNGGTEKDCTNCEYLSNCISYHEDTLVLLLQYIWMLVKDDMIGGKCNTAIYDIKDKLTDIKESVSPLMDDGTCDVKKPDEDLYS